jgi:predicted CopG family antitoxin
MKENRSHIMIQPETYAKLDKLRHTKLGRVSFDDVINRLLRRNRK